MNRPNKIARKGWKLYSSGNVVSTFSSVFIAIALILAIVILIPVAVPKPPYELTSEIAMILLLSIIILNVLALLFVLIGKLLFWKGLSFLLGALQIPTSIVPESREDTDDREIL